jgi:ring-1,2-phenylacetyl-CoA epoxidase subunit PaaE
MNLERNPGRINKSSLHRFLEDYGSPISPQKFFICGPGSMIDDLESELLNIGVAREFMHSERFHPETGKVNEFELRKTDMAMSSKAKITLDGNYIELEIQDQTILQTLIDAGYDPPFSCTSGVCTTCMAKLTRGAVEMEVNYGLDEDDVKKGFILTCQSHPTTEEIEVNYDF